VFILSNKKKQMIAVIFEAFPAEGKWDEYLDIAAKLRPELEKIDGFISIERFQSIADSSKVLALSFWENEESIAAWRNLELHRNAQARGRAGIFRDYRIRVGNINRDYSMINREQAPADTIKKHQTVVK
jgi:heme-degrading monooxygenase HmoA